MNTFSHKNENNNSEYASVGSAFRGILQESRRRRVVIRDKSGKKILDWSLLLALILSIGAPVIPAFVILGVLVDVISVSFESK